MAAHGRYTLLRKIAEGGTAEVFLAHQVGSAGFKRLVVLKRVRPALWADESFRRMLIDEAHISMALHHGNIVQVLDLGASGPHYFLAFELVDGWSLSQVVKRARAAQVEFPLNLALHVMTQVCRALAYAHGKTEGGAPMGIVHRDVTPHNVLLSTEGEVKLADFGIAKARSRITTSQVGQVKGKPAYMSPEQALGAPLDARSDLFAVGVGLYWLVTGELPFAAPNELEALARVVQGSFVPAEKKRPGLPKAVAKLVAKALQRDPEDRFQSADEMLAELERLQRGKVLEPAGQTELKAWLAVLAGKDGARPIGWLEVPRPRQAELGADESEEIQLVDDEDLVVSSQASEAVLATPEPSPSRSPRRWGRALAVGALSAGVVSAGVWLSVRSGGPTAPPPSSVGPSPATVAPALPSARAPTAPAMLVDLSDPPDAGAAVGPPGDASAPGLDAEVVVADAHDAGRDTLGVPADAGARGAGDEAKVLGVDAGTDGLLDEPPDGDPADADAGATTSDAGAGAADDAGVRTTPPRAVPAAATFKATEAARVTRRPATPSKAPARTSPPPAAKTPAVENTVSVLLESDPPGAEVAIERRVFGKTPIPLRLKVGITFELVFSKPGYRVHRQLYRVGQRAGQRVRVTLTKAGARP